MSSSSAFYIHKLLEISTFIHSMALASSFGSCLSLEPADNRISKPMLQSSAYNAYRLRENKSITPAMALLLYLGACLCLGSLDNRISMPTL